MKNIYKLLCIPLTVATLGADSSRSEKWEFFFSPLYMGSNTITFDGGGEANINSRTGFGFGFGYNINENFELSMLFTSSSSTYDVSFEDKDGNEEKGRSNLYMSSFNLAATYNFIDGPLTPYVTGTFGSTYVDSGVTSGDTDWYCNPYYYGGCYPYADTFGGTKLNYGGSVGVRYDFENALFLKAGVGMSWIDFDNSSSNDFIVYDLSIGATF